MYPQINESDWKLFRAKLSGWQEDYISRLNQEYAVLLTGPGSASEKFWALEKRIRNDRQRIGVVARMSRSNMYTNIIALLHHGVIGLDDLNGFSKEIQELAAFAVKNDEVSSLP